MKANESCLGILAGYPRVLDFASSHLLVPALRTLLFLTRSPTRPQLSTGRTKTLSQSPTRTSASRSLGRPSSLRSLARSSPEASATSPFIRSDPLLPFPLIPLPSTSLPSLSHSVTPSLKLLREIIFWVASVPKGSRRAVYWVVGLERRTDPFVLCLSQPLPSSFLPLPPLIHRPPSPSIGSSPSLSHTHALPQNVKKHVGR